MEASVCFRSVTWAHTRESCELQYASRTIRILPLALRVRNSEQDKILARDSGADDYAVKPFAMGELLARIRAALRRSSSEAAPPKIELPELSIDVENRIVEVRGARAHSAPKEFELLALLVIHQGKPLTHRRLLQTVWGPDHGEETENLRVVITQLRNKIEKDPVDPRYILTEPSVGYRFELPSAASEKHAAAKRERHRSG